MRSLINRIKLSKLAILVRNTINIKPIDIITLDIKRSSISDAFLWRTDNGFETLFKFSDILNLFYKIEDSEMHMEFYNKENKLIKNIKVTNLKLSNKLLINSKFLGGTKDYGIFYVYHSSKHKFYNNDSITNKCYLGYRLNKNIFSFVHGNTLSKSRPINLKEKKTKTDPVKMSLLNNQIYKIQKYFKNYDKTELMFCNPTSSNVNFFIEKEKFCLKEGCSQIINFNNIGTITVRSNCMFLRPTVFNYKNKYMDVHHS
jgi:hypothetical protein